MNINLFTKLHKQPKGFTLVETLVAISIFSVSILALLSVLTQSIADTNYAKQKMIAGYLAQEGVEYLRNMRDTYTLFGSTGQIGWDAYNARLSAAACTAANGCYFNDQSVDYSNLSQPILSTTMTACGESCPGLLYDAATGKYGYATGSSSGFIRKISVVESANQVHLVSTVFWTQKSRTYSISLSENLFNWIE